MRRKPLEARIDDAVEHILWCGQWQGDGFVPLRIMRDEAGKLAVVETGWFHNRERGLKRKLREFLGRWSGRSVTVLYSPLAFSKKRALAEYAVESRLAYVDADDPHPSDKVPEPTRMVASSAHNGHWFWVLSAAVTPDQLQSINQLLRLIRENGGAIVADEVGLGKTFIAGEILKQRVDNRQRCLLICPAQLRDSTWKKFRATHFLGDVECLSYEELAIDRQIGLADPSRAQEKLQRPLHEYQLVVVDEAHNYRNPDTPTRAMVLRKLLWGQQREVLLLTATPVNNSLCDLYHLIRYYLRQDSVLADHGILSIYERFREASKQEPASLSPDLLFPVIDATTVKRTRQFVKKHYGGDLIRLPDGTETTISFPEPRVISVRYPLSTTLTEVFDLIDECLVGAAPLRFARFVPDAYLLDAGEDRLIGDEDARQAALIALLRSGLLKRFESSAFAFGSTLEKMIGEHRKFLSALDAGHVIRSELIREVSAIDDEELDAILAAKDDATPAGLSDHFSSASRFSF